MPIDITGLFQPSDGVHGFDLIEDQDIAYAARSANQVFSGPTSGGPATPTFRSLVAADIPSLSLLLGTLPVASGGTGATTLTGLLKGNGTGAVTTVSDSSTVGQVLRVTGAATYAWGALDLSDPDAVTGTLPAASLGTHDHSGASAGGDVLAPRKTTITGTADELNLDVKGVLNQANPVLRVLSGGTTNPPNPLPVQTAGIRMFQVDASGTVTVSDPTHTDNVTRFQVRAPNSQASGINIFQIVRANAVGPSTTYTALSVGPDGTVVCGDRTDREPDVVRLRVNQAGTGGPPGGAPSTQSVDMVQIRNAADVNLISVNSAGQLQFSTTAGATPIRIAGGSPTATKYLGSVDTTGDVTWRQIAFTDISGTLGVASGGTGATTLTGLLQGNGTSAVTTVTNSSTIGQVLRVIGAAAYAWGAIDLGNSDAVSGVLPANKLGTHDHSSSTQGGDTLNPVSLNCLRSAAGDGPVVITQGSGQGDTDKLVHIKTKAAASILYVTEVSVVSRVGVQLGTAASPVTVIFYNSGGGTHTISAGSSGSNLLTLPNVTGTFAVIDAAQTWTAKPTFSAATPIRISSGSPASNKYLGSVDGTGDAAWRQVTFADLGGTLTTHDHSSSAQGGITLNPTGLVTCQYATDADGPFIIKGGATQAGSRKLFQLQNLAGVPLIYMTQSDVVIEPGTLTLGKVLANQGVLKLYNSTGGLWNISPSSIGASSYNYTLSARTGYFLISPFFVPDETAEPPSGGNVARVNRSGLTGNVGIGGSPYETSPIVIANATDAGFYEIHCYMSTSVTSAGSQPALTVFFTDDVGAKSLNIASLVMTTSAAVGSGTRMIYLNSGNITWQVTGYTGGTYNLRVRIKYLGP